MRHQNEQFHLPDVGEGLTEAEIVAWRVAPGDRVEVNQIIVEIETAKSVVELPCPFAGEVAELHADEGETVAVGRPIISVTTAVGSETTTTAASDRAVAPNGSATANGGASNGSAAQGARANGAAASKGEAALGGEANGAAAASGDPQLLVGYGAPESDGPRRRRRSSAVAANADAGEAAVPAAAASGVVHPAERVGPSKAKPPVRKLAKLLGVDLDRVKGTGRDGVILRADVLRVADGADSAEVPGPLPSGATVPDPVPAREDVRIPISGIRKYTAAAMVSSAFTAPHVTEFITVDITRTIELRDQIARRPEFRDVKLTPLAFVASAFLRAIERTPLANSRWEEESQEIVQLGTVNLGIAAATPRGLVVPNIKDAGRRTLLELATAISELTVTARAGKTTPADMANGTTTITNVGVFGVDTGTPILNPGETSILAFGVARRTPWVIEDADGERIEPRWVTQLALSFDHRVIDGQQGSQLLADTAAVLREPGLAVL